MKTSHPALVQALLETAAHPCRAVAALADVCGLAFSTRRVAALGLPRI